MDTCRRELHLSVEEITTCRALEALQTDWAELWARCPTATPFQSPHWLIPWWRHLGQGELWLLTFREEGRLRALAPLCTRQDSDFRRHVLLMGTGISDYQDLLIEPGFEQPFLTRFISHLAAEKQRWDACDFQQLPETSLLLNAGQSSLESEIAPQEVCPVLPLSAEFGGLRGQIPARMLEKLRYYGRRAESLGATRIESAQPENFAELFEAFLRLHGSRWGARGQKGVLANEPLKAFHEEVAESLLRIGALRLYGLRLGNDLKASLYGFSHGRRVFYYLSGFDPGLAALSPGTLMIGHAVEQALEDGAAEFDFLRRGEAYKYLWGAKDRWNYRLRLSAPARTDASGPGGRIPD